jgi:hypothetical protein
VGHSGQGKDAHFSSSARKLHLHVSTKDHIIFSNYLIKNRLARLNFDHETDLIISGGEGGCIDIWKLKADATLEHRQAMKVPVESVWSVAPMSNGDFATATR